jgi:hypothetical protein
MRALEGVQTGLFADELVAHIQGFAPSLSVSMGRDAVRTTVSMGLKNARGYGFTLRGPARFYVEAMFMLGSFFDTDPQYRAITQALFDEDDAGEMARADRLYEKVMEFVDITSGQQHEYEKLALSRAAQARYENVISFAQRPASDLVGVLYKVYPEKAQYIGEAAVSALVEKAYAIAANRGPSWAKGGALFAGLMFAFGHGCFSDPQYPWIAGSLEKAESRDAASANFEPLFRKFSIYLGRAKNNLEAR